MAYLNKCFLIGRITRDPELRVTPKGTSIAAFGLTINRQSKNADGSHADETTFVDIEAWGKQADLVAKYLARGTPAEMRDGEQVSRPPAAKPVPHAPESAPALDDDVPFDLPR